MHEIFRNMLLFLLGGITQSSPVCRSFKQDPLFDIHLTRLIWRFCEAKNVRDEVAAAEEEEGEEEEEEEDDVEEEEEDDDDDDEEEEEESRGQKKVMVKRKRTE